MASSDAGNDSAEFWLLQKDKQTVLWWFCGRNLQNCHTCPWQPWHPSPTNWHLRLLGDTIYSWEYEATILFMHLRPTRWGQQWEKLIFIQTWQPAGVKTEVKVKWFILPCSQGLCPWLDLSNFRTCAMGKETECVFERECVCECAIIDVIIVNDLKMNNYINPKTFAWYFGPQHHQSIRWKQNISYSKLAGPFRFFLVTSWLYRPFQKRARKIFSYSY